MRRDPLAGMADAPLFIVPRVLDRLRAFRPAFDGLAEGQGARLRAAFDSLRDRLLEGIAAHPTKFWVMKQFLRSLETIRDEDAPARRQAGKAFDELMAMLGIDDPDGVIAHCLGWP